MEEFLRGLGNRPEQPSQDEKNALRDILDGFEDEDEMRRFYQRLPVPWNVVPQPTGRKQDNQKMIQMTIKSKDHFTGEMENGTYLEWRTVAINRIHSKPFTIMDKIHLLSSIVKQDDDENLRVIFRTGVHSPRVYRNIIRSLEGHYGGKERTYTYLRNQMLRMSRFSLNNLRSLSIARAKVDKFIEHISVHQVGEDRPQENRTLLGLFLSNVLTFEQVRKYREDGVSMGVGAEETYSLETLAQWLRFHEDILEWSGMNYNPTVMGVHRLKKKESSSSHKVLMAEGATSRASRNAGASKSTPQKTKTSRVTLVTNNKQEETSEEEEDEETPEGTEEEDETPSEDAEEEEEYVTGEEDEPVDEVALAASEARLPICSFCKNIRHRLHVCEEFLKLPIKERAKFVNDDKRCANCLSPSHKTKKCSSTYKCKECGSAKHHTVTCFKTLKNSPENKEKR